MGVPLFASSLERYHDALIERVAAVARSGRYILGPEVEAFERELADYLGVAHVIGVANGTDALTIALRALGVRPGGDLGRRDAGLLRRRPGDLLRHARDGRAGAHRPHPRGRARAPVRQRRSGR